MLYQVAIDRDGDEVTTVEEARKVARLFGEQIIVSHAEDAEFGLYLASLAPWIVERFADTGFVEITDGQHTITVEEL